MSTYTFRISWTPTPGAWSIWAFQDAHRHHHTWGRGRGPSCGRNLLMGRYGWAVLHGIRGVRPGGTWPFAAPDICTFLFGLGKSCQNGKTGFAYAALCKGVFLWKVNLFWTDFNQVWIFPPKWHAIFTKMAISVGHNLLKLKFWMFEMVENPSF